MSEIESNKDRDTRITPLDLTDSTDDTELSPEQQAEYQHILDWRAGREAMSEAHTLTKQDQPLPAELQEKIQASKEAGTALIEQYSKWIQSQARRHLRIALIRGHEIEDMFQAGAIGLLRAAEKYDPDKGANFMTYATYDINSAIKRVIRVDGTAPDLTQRGNTEKIRVHLVKDELTQKLRREPTVSEIAERADMAQDDVQLYLYWDEVGRIISLDSNFGTNTDEHEYTDTDGWPQTKPTIEDDLVDPAQELTEDLVIDELVSGELLESISKVLSDREIAIISYRFGLQDGHSRSLEEVGKEFGVTRERIRQIEAKALSKLRSDQRMSEVALDLEPIGYPIAPAEEQPKQPEPTEEEIEALKEIRLENLRATQEIHHELGAILSRLEESDDYGTIKEKADLINSLADGTNQLSSQEISNFLESIDQTTRLPQAYDRVEAANRHSRLSIVSYREKLQELEKKFSLEDFAELAQALENVLRDHNPSRVAAYVDAFVEHQLEEKQD